MCLNARIYLGVSLQGAFCRVRDDVNRAFYGHKVSAKDILSGMVRTLFHPLFLCALMSVWGADAGLNFDAALCCIASAASVHGQIEPPKAAEPLYEALDAYRKWVMAGVLSQPGTDQQGSGPTSERAGDSMRETAV